MADNGEFSFPKTPTKGRNGLPKIQTHGKKDDKICHDDSVPTVKAQTIDELHSLQKKRSVPNTPIKGTTPMKGDTQPAFNVVSDEERQKQQLQSISASLASLTRESGPKVVKGDPDRKAETPRAHVTHQERHVHAPSFSTSDSSLKFTHILYNLSPAELYEQAIKYEKGSFITSSGALATLSGAKTGRSPRDKRVVRDETTEDELWWGKGSPNIEMDEHTFLVNRERAVDYLCSLDKVYVNDQFLNWDPVHRIKVRIVSARAYHSLFMHNMCIRPTAEELEDFGTPDFTIYNAGMFPCNRYTHYMTSSTSVDLNLARREMVILGTQYAGEMKKGLFGVMHYLMPKRQILSLHSGCNMGKDGDVALFFGLSGTGKTTLSTDHNRYLIGDDEHCWSENGNQEMGKLMHNTQIKHSSHPHLLQLSPTLHLQNQQNCAGCNLQISSHDHTEQVYTCAPCGFFLHQSCTKFPQLITHPSHREHSLSLLPTPIYPGGFFRCDACTQHGTKFSYHCHFCDYDLHVLCASKPLSTNHPFHPHPLVLTFSSPYGEKLGFSCDVCQSVGSCDQWLYRCDSCEFDVHLHCALVKVQPHQQPQPHPQPPPLQHTYSFPGAAQPNHSMAAAGQPLPHSMSTGHIQPNYWQPQPQPRQNNPQPQPSSFQQPPQQVGIQSNYNMPMQTSGPAMNNNNNNQNNGLADVIVTGFVEGMAQQLGQDLVQSLTGGGNDGGNNNNYDGTASTNDEY